ncbi:uncharacterized protein WM277_015449 [Molossus nigricans]
MESALLDLRQQDLRVQICHSISCLQFKNSRSFQRFTRHTEMREQLPGCRDTRRASCTGTSAAPRSTRRSKLASPRRSSQHVLSTRNNNSLTTVSSMEKTGCIRPFASSGNGVLQVGNETRGLTGPLARAATAAPPLSLLMRALWLEAQVLLRPETGRAPAVCAPPEGSSGSGVTIFVPGV